MLPVLQRPYPKSPLEEANCGCNKTYMLSFRGAMSAYTSFPTILSPATSNDVGQHGRSLTDAPESSPKPECQILGLQICARAQHSAQGGKQKAEDAQHGMEKLTDSSPLRSMLSIRTEFPTGTATRRECCRYRKQYLGRRPGC
jgi:hypothetical protein